MKRGLSSYYLLVFILALFSCKKDPILSDSSAKLDFSESKILFDTVFTSIGSVTKNLKVYNNHDKKLIISSIRLANGNNSDFRLNINGTPTKSLTDIEIDANDSLYIFVEVTVDPNGANTPLVITDSILFETNSNLQDIDLIAWGQDAHYFYPDTYVPGLPAYSIVCNETWINDKPYVVYGYLVVDSACTLTIEAGTRIHFHNNGGLWVYRGGTLKVNGSMAEPVSFQGDRLEYAYKDIPGQWDRIWLNEGSINNEINYAIIKNGFIGIQAEPLIGHYDNDQKLILTNTIIENMSGMGIYSRNYRIHGYNNVVANCGTYTLAITLGGSYNFRHCTFANYWGYSSRSEPSILINNYDSYQALNLDSAYFGNCILYGDLENEIGLDFSGSATSNYKFDYSLLRIDPTINTSDLAHYNNIFKNLDPKFKDPATNNYELDTLSNAIDKGNINISNNSPAIPTDIKGTNRLSDIAPDLGAYERIY